MTIEPDPNRRRFLEHAVATAALSPIAALATPALGHAVVETSASGPQSNAGAGLPLMRLQPLKYVDAGVLNIAYYETGPADGPVAMLLHGFPYDIHSYVDVAPMLAIRGIRVIVPYLRGYAPTRFLDAGTMKSGEQAALGADLIALMDALGVERAVVAGYDWGGRAACVAAALFPERCTGLVCVNSYLVQDIAASQRPVSPKGEVPLWYQYYFHQERGRAGLQQYRREIARILWTQWSPKLEIQRRYVRACGSGLWRPGLRRCRHSFLSASFWVGTWGRAVFAASRAAERTAFNNGAGHHPRWQRRRRGCCERWQSDRVSVHREPSAPNCPGGWSQPAPGGAPGFRRCCS